MPDRERTFRLPFGDVIPFIAFYASNLIVYWAGWTVNWKLFVTVVLGFVLLAVFHLTGRGNTPALDWRAGATWVLPWLGGLCLISYLGDYPDKKTDPGARNTHTITFGWGFVMLLVLSAIIYVARDEGAPAKAQVEQNIEDTRAESEAEEAELGAEV